jgi:RNA polymerase sigma-70 factor, ECF subfamily
MESNGAQGTIRIRVDRDRELVDALRRGEATAVEHLVAAYGDRAYRLAARITRTAQDAEEVVQDAFWTVVRKIDTFRGEAAFGSWFYRIVANTAYGKLRGGSKRRAEVSLDEVLPYFDASGHHAHSVADWSVAVEDVSRQAELREVLISAIDELPPAYRTVLVLRDVEGLSPSEIGKALEISVSSVKTRVHRARLFLRKRLADYMVSVPLVGKHERIV